MEPNEVIEALPLNNRASPKQLLALMVSIVALMIIGGFVTWTVKSYFDNWHQEILAEIGKSEAKFDQLAVSTDRNAAEIAGIKKYYWSNMDQQQWVHALDKANRTLSVPEVQAVR